MAKFSMTAVPFAVVLALSLSASASAVGDPPISLSKSKAQRVFSKYKSLTSADSLAVCPGEQTVMSGSITGGDSPAGGGRTTKIHFNKGAELSISETWMRERGKIPAAPVVEATITCRLK